MSQVPYRLRYAARQVGEILNCQALNGLTCPYQYKLTSLTPLRREAKMKMAELLLLKVYPFTFLVLLSPAIVSRAAKSADSDITASSVAV